MIHERPPAGEIAAENVSPETYMADYAHQRYEWVRGYLIKMSSITSWHDDLTGYLYILLKAYFTLNTIGVVRREPFVQRLDAVESRREPDLQIILNDNPGQLTETAMIGGADICIEVVSPGSEATDYGAKMVEYEQGGVREYWLLDYRRKLARFLRLNDDGIYIAVEPDAQDHYQTPLLPKFKLHIPTLWTDALPDIFTATESVKAMMEE